MKLIKIMHHISWILAAIDAFNGQYAQATFCMAWAIMFWLELKEVEIKDLFKDFSISGSIGVESQE